MDVPGFTLLLQDFCGYCPDFDAEVDTFDCKSLGGPPKATHSIRCRNRRSCARIAENLKVKRQNE